MNNRRIYVVQNYTTVLRRGKPYIKLDCHKQGLEDPQADIVALFAGPDTSYYQAYWQDGWWEVSDCAIWSDQTNSIELLLYGNWLRKHRPCI